MRGLPQKQNARRADKIRLCGHLRRYKKIVKKTYIIYLKFDTVFYFVTAVISVLRNAMQGLGETVIPLVSSALEMIGKVVIAVTLVPLLGYTGVIVAEPIVWIIMVIPLIVKIFKMPELKKTA